MELVPLMSSITPLLKGLVFMHQFVYLPPRMLLVAGIEREYYILGMYVCSVRVYCLRECYSSSSCCESLAREQMGGTTPAVRSLGHFNHAVFPDVLSMTKEGSASEASMKRSKSLLGLRIQINEWACLCM
jgi:hypothetical protein